MSLSVTIFDDNLSTQIPAFEILNDYDVRTTLLAQVIRAEFANLRAGNAHTKTRGEVSGGGKKPWKQKGTGRARHGSSRSPIWVGGGVSHGPRNLTNWTQRINKTSRIAALKSILKDRLDNNSVYQFAPAFDFPRTKNADISMANFGVKKLVNPKKTLVIYTSEEKEKLRGFTNTEVKMINAKQLQIHKLAEATSYLLTPDARVILEERIAKNR